MTLPSRLAALTLCATFLAGQPTVICDVVCAMHAHRASDPSAGAMVVDAQHGHRPEMTCRARQVRTDRVPPSALVVSTSLPVTFETFPLPMESNAVAWRGGVSPGGSAVRAVDPPPPRLS